jgi:hypothetical protein
MVDVQHLSGARVARRARLAGAIGPAEAGESNMNRVMELMREHDAELALTKDINATFHRIIDQQREVSALLDQLEQTLA